MSAPLFRVGPGKTELLAEPEALRADFARLRALECPAAIGPDLLALVQRLLDQGGFEHHDVEKLGDREVEAPERAGPALVLALHRSNLLEWLDRATGCGPLDAVMGRVVQARAGQGHQLDWHDDRQDSRRRLAITINLGTAPYDGGLFEIRRKQGHDPVFAHRHTDPGTALIFQVAADIQHRIQPITAGGPRRVFTGWFLAPEEAAG